MADFIEALASAVVMYGVQEYTPVMRRFCGRHPANVSGENLEATVDRCQHVGDLVERIVIKNA